MHDCAPTLVITRKEPTDLSVSLWKTIIPTCMGNGIRDPWGCCGLKSLPVDQILGCTLLAMAQKDHQGTGNRNKKHKPLIEIDPKEWNII